jgi:hypothetical protein
MISLDVNHYIWSPVLYLSQWIGLWSPQTQWFASLQAFSWNNSSTERARPNPGNFSGSEFEAATCDPRDFFNLIAFRPGARWARRSRYEAKRSIKNWHDACRKIYNAPHA